jgi:predicted O-methyltransferase YrrM
MQLKQNIIDLLNTMPYIRGLHRKNKELVRYSMYPPGHFYSPIVSFEDIIERQDRLWAGEKKDSVACIELNNEGQLSLMRELEHYYEEMPFTEHKNEKNRFYLMNDYYTYTDAIVLYSMIRHHSPKKIFEIGSGFSSAVMLDTNMLFFKDEIDITFIEPYADRLKSLLRESDRKHSHLIERRIQDVDPSIFESLEENDILFIDSSHVVKTGSDVNHILFEILPRLKSGVLIHFHDIFYPFEYRRDWVLKGRNWNEDYFLRSFLMYNEKFRIILFADYLHKHHAEAFAKMNLCYRDTGGCLWIKKM